MRKKNRKNIFFVNLSCHFYGLSAIITHKIAVMWKK